MGPDALRQVCCQLHVRFPHASKSWQLQIVSITFCQFSNGLLISWHWYCLSFFKFIKDGKNRLEKVWLSDDPPRSMMITLPEASDTQVRATKLLPYSTSTILPSIHTIILDFSMVHLVDARALVVLRQVSTKEVFTRALIPAWVLLVTDQLLCDS